MILLESGHFSLGTAVLPPFPVSPWLRRSLEALQDECGG